MGLWLCCICLCLWFEFLFVLLCLKIDSFGLGCFAVACWVCV